MATNLAIDSSDIAAALRALQQTPAIGVNAISNAAGVTLTAAQMVAGTILRSGAAGVSDTTATAAGLVAAFPGCAVGTVRILRIRNNNTGTLTILAGAGVTLEGTTTIPTVNTRDYAIRFTNVTPGAEAVTLSGLFVAAV